MLLFHACGLKWTRMFAMEVPIIAGVRGRLAQRGVSEGARAEQAAFSGCAAPFALARLLRWGSKT